MATSGMQLRPPPTDTQYDTALEALNAINAFAKGEGYAVTTKRTLSRTKEGPAYKAYLVCSKSGVTKRRGKHRFTSTRRCDCPFKGYMVHKKSSGKWELRIKDASHNHGPSSADSSAIHRRDKLLADDQEIRRVILQMSKRNSTPDQILTFLREDAEAKGQEFILRKEDISNTKRDMRRHALKGLTPTVAILKELRDNENWKMEYRVNDAKQLTHLFFAHTASIELLKKNPEVVLMDCTYKTNRYRLPLLAIQGVSATNASYIIGFAFLLQETEHDYAWAITQIKALYQYLNLPNPKVLITDADLALENAIEAELPDSKHLLCEWHINQNVTDAANELLLYEEDQVAFKETWHKVIYSTSRADYTRNWQAMKEKYDTMPDVLDYIEETWLYRKEKFVRCFTNKVTHFGNCSTSRTEGGHASLKHRLELSTGDIWTVVDKIETLIKDRTTTERKKCSKEKDKIPFDLGNKSFLRHLNHTTSEYARKKILKQYHLIKALPQGGELPPCTGVFRRTMGLPCAHEIQEQINSVRGGLGVLSIEDVHPHWLWDPRPRHRPAEQILSDEDILRADPDGISRPTAHIGQRSLLEGGEPLATSVLDDADDDESLPDIDTIVQTLDPPIRQGKGRPKGSTKAKTASRKRDKEQEHQQARENTTRRDPSSFEYTQRRVDQRTQQRIAQTGSQLTSTTNNIPNSRVRIPSAPRRKQATADRDSDKENEDIDEYGNIDPSIWDNDQITGLDLPGDVEASQASAATTQIPPKRLPGPTKPVLRKRKQKQQQNRREKTPEDETLAGGAMMHAFRL